jgi:imidazolonepropionase-like amidohydrolase
MAYLIANGESDERYPADVLDERNRIAAVAEGRGQLNGDGVEVIDGAGMTLMPGLVEGRCQLPFVDPMRNQDLGEIPPEEHLLRTCGRGGALADLLLVEGNPLADPSVLVGADRFAMIMKDGKMHRDLRGSRGAFQRRAAE